MMNKKIFSLIIIFASLSAVMSTFCGKPENMIDDIIEVRIRLGQKKSYERSSFMLREQQKNIGIIPNVQGEESFHVANTIYLDQKNRRERDWGSAVPWFIQKFLINKYKKSHDCQDLTEDAGSELIETFPLYRFPSSLPASVVQELQKNGSVVCHNEWGHVVISLENYQPKPKREGLLSIIWALFARTPNTKTLDLKSVQSKAAQENIKTRDIFKKNRESFVVPTWQE